MFSWIIHEITLYRNLKTSTKWAYIITGVDIRTSFNEELDYFKVSSTRSLNQGCEAILCEKSKHNVHVLLLVWNTLYTCWSTCTCTISFLFTTTIMTTTVALMMCEISQNGNIRYLLYMWSLNKLSIPKGLNFHGVYFCIFTAFCYKCMIITHTHTHQVQLVKLTWLPSVLL